MKRLLTFLLLASLTYGGIATTQICSTNDNHSPQQPLKHKKVPVNEYRKLLEVLHQMYGLGSPSFSSATDSVEITPERISEYIYYLENIYNFRLKKIPRKEYNLIFLKDYNLTASPFIDKRERLHFKFLLNINSLRLSPILLLKPDSAHHSPYSSASLFLLSFHSRQQ